MSITDAVTLLRPLRVGLFLSILTLLYGYGMGIAFGAREDAIKASLKARAEAVRNTVYTTDGAFDQAKFKKVTDKSWVYLKRAHLHANGIGTTATALCLMLSLMTGTKRGLRTLIGILLGLGAAGYSSFWMFAGLRAPGLGSTGLAKEGLKWLALPSAAAATLGVLLTLVVLIGALFCRKAEA